MGLDDALRGPTAYGLDVSPLSQQQADGTQQDGFASTGFTCNDREATLEGDIQAFDKCVILNM